VRRQQHFGGRGLKGDAALGTDDGVPEVYAAADAKRGPRSSSRSITATGVIASPSTPVGTPRGTAACGAQAARLREGVVREHPASSGILAREVRVSLPPIVTPTGHD